MKSRILKIAAVLLALVVPAAAIALTVNSNYTPQVRDLSIQAVHYYRFAINYNDPNIANGVGFAKLKQNAFIKDVACHVTTTFNAGSTNVVTLGTDATNANQIITASGSNSSINEASATYQAMSSSPALGVYVTSAADVTLYAKYTQTGTAASQGQVICELAFVPPGDFQ